MTSFKTRSGNTVYVLPALPPIPEPRAEQGADEHIDCYNAAKRMRDECAASLRASGLTVAFADA